MLSGIFIRCERSRGHNDKSSRDLAMLTSRVQVAAFLHLSLICGQYSGFMKSLNCTPYEVETIKGLKSEGAFTLCSVIGDCTISRLVPPHVGNVIATGGPAQPVGLCDGIYGVSRSVPSPHHFRLSPQAPIITANNAIAPRELIAAIGSNQTKH